MNYVFFFPDEMRAEALGCYGSSFIKTPNFDTLAAQGILFEQCHVQNPVCSPSRCCLFTGRYPHSDGHRSLWNLIKPNEKNLMGYLREAGYDVRIYGKNDVFSPEAAEKFTDEFIPFGDSLKSPVRPVKDYGEQGYYNFLYKPSDGGIEDIADYKIVEKGIEFIRSWKPGDKPFMLFLPMLYPHCPYTAPESFYGMYLDKLDQIDPRPVCEKKPAFHSLIRKYRNLDTADARKIQAVYASMVSYSDMLLGRVMDCLSKTGRDQDTMLIASSDHGDYAGDYGLVEKWPSGAEDVLTRVPLIIRSPGCRAGHRVKEIVEMFDIMPTILETAGIKPQHQFYAKSLVKQLGGATGDPDRLAFCEGGYNPNEFQCSEGADKPSVEWMKDPHNIYYPKHLQQKRNPESSGRSVMARSLQYKYIRRCFGDHELYDLQKDPRELNNVYGDPAYSDIQREFELKILDWYLETADAAPFEEDARVIKNKVKDEI